MGNTLNKPKDNTFEMTYFLPPDVRALLDEYLRDINSIESEVTKKSLASLFVEQDDGCSDDEKKYLSTVFFSEIFKLFIKFLFHEVSEIGKKIPRIKTPLERVNYYLSNRSASALESNAFRNMTKDFFKCDVGGINPEAFILAFISEWVKKTPENMFKHMLPYANINLVDPSLRDQYVNFKDEKHSFWYNEKFVFTYKYVSYHKYMCKFFRLMYSNSVDLDEVSRLLSVLFDRDLWRKEAFGYA
jgi:hypothetical protein